MIPKTLSASSMQVWQLCPDRWAAEYFDRAASFSTHTAADVGTSVHGGLEMFVRAVYIDKTHAGLDRVKAKELLLSYYQMSYAQTFNSADFDTSEYRDGLALTMEWYKRTSFESVVEVESVELKETIPVPYNRPDGSVDEIPFNYVMDRLDRMGETSWRVVDYKTIRVPIQPEDLENKIQARAYALAVQIKHPEATEVEVCFDLLRHQPVSLFFTRDDNIAFWHFLVATTQEIVDRPRDKALPILNAECGYCVKKYDCPLMLSNIAAGGVHSLDIDQTALLIDKLKNQMKANKVMVDELEEKVLRWAADTDTLSWETSDGSNEVEVGMGNRRRNFNAQRAAEIMGPELFAQMGNMTIGNLEKIIKDPALDQDMRDQLAALLVWGNGNLTVKVKPKTKLVS